MDRRKSGVTSRYVVLLACLSLKKKEWKRMESGIGNEFASHHKTHVHLVFPSPRKGARGVHGSRDGNNTHMCFLGEVWKEAMAV